MIEPRRPTLPRLVRLAFGVAVTAYVAIAAWLVWRTSILEPYSDMFDWLVRWRRFQADGDLWRYLWAPHNLHHLVWTLAVLDLDIRGFGAQGDLFLAVGVLCLAATGVLLAWAGAVAAGRGLRLVGAGGAVALSAMGCHVLDASAAINTTYLHALVFAVAAILLAESPGSHPRTRQAGALACAVAAGLGSAAGLAVWPALLLGAWRSGRRGWGAAVILTGLAFGLLYLVGEAAPGGAGAAGVPHAAEAVLLFVNYLGLPWARAIPAAGSLIGLAILIPALASIAFKGGKGAPWPERAAVGLIAFSLTTAAMAGAARTGLIAPDLVPMRYSVFLIPLHVGLWILALPHIRRAWARRPRPIEATVVAAAGVMLLHQGVMALYAVRTADINLRVIADFREGRRTPAMPVTIYGDLDRARAIGEELRRDGLYQRELRPDPPQSPNAPGISASSPGP